MLIDAPNALDRVNYYEGGFGYALRGVTVETAVGSVEAQAYFPDASVPPPAEAFDVSVWASRWGTLSCIAAQEAMESFGQITAQELAARMPMMRMRAHARVLAQAEDRVPEMPGRPTADVRVHQERRPYTNYFSVREDDVQVPQFGGGLGPVVNRAAMISADAVLVLPYDPVRDRVLLVEQFRFSPFFRGDPDMFMLEPIAGRVDPGEMPEETARREAIEEAGLTLGPLHEVTRNYPCPANLTEYLYFYVALTDLPGDVVGIGGLETEAEDIRSHLMAFDTFQEWLDNDWFRTAPLILLGHWLVRHRDRLRKDAGATA